MKKYIRFYDMTVVVPVDDNETTDEAEERLLDALDTAGTKYIGYRSEVVDELGQEASLNGA